VWCFVALSVALEVAALDSCFPERASYLVRRCRELLVVSELSAASD
jgi:hypothetical protein